jgi:hypothetical protein
LRGVCLQAPLSQEGDQLVSLDIQVALPFVSSGAAVVVNAGTMLDLLLASVISPTR